MLRVSGFGFRFSGFGFRFSVFGFRFSVFGFRISGFGFRVPGFVFRVSGFGFEGSFLHAAVLGDDDPIRCRDYVSTRAEPVSLIPNPCSVPASLTPYLGKHLRVKTLQSFFTGLYPQTQN